MKLFLRIVAFALAVAAGSSSAASAIEECRHIKAQSERLACYDRQSNALAEKHKAAPASNGYANPVDLLKIENDRVTQRLKGICRGC
jgi:hypothetical protein